MLFVSPGLSISRKSQTNVIFYYAKGEYFLTQGIMGSLVPKIDAILFYIAIHVSGAFFVDSVIVLFGLGSGTRCRGYAIILQKKCVDGRGRAAPGEPIRDLE